MITINESIPRKSKSFLLGLDVFYVQFNDISFYVEDENRENFYFELLSKLFPDVRLAKIFPLGGKAPVVAESERHPRSKKKVFILDKDFDDLLGEIVYRPNLFYLTHYSVENFLISEGSVVNFIIEEKTTLQRKSVVCELQFKKRLKTATRVFYKLTLLHILVQIHSLGIQNVTRVPERYIDFAAEPVLDEIKLASYEAEVETKLKSIDSRYTTNGQLKKLRQELKLTTPAAVLPHIPGKYLVKYFKAVAERGFGTGPCAFDSFSMRLAKNSTFGNLSGLKRRIQNYISAA